MGLLCRGKWMNEWLTEWMENEKVVAGWWWEKINNKIECDEKKEEKLADYIVK